MTRHTTQLPFTAPGDVAQLIEQAKREQLAADAAAICNMCDDPQRFEPAVWHDDDGYYHTRKRDGAELWCDADLLWLAWAEAHEVAA